MAWTDNLQEAAYTSLSGTRISFRYEDVSKTINKKTTGFDFPDADGTFVQDLGRAGNRYPLRIFFSGADYDQVAAAFETALVERGEGKLEHPIYGTVNVVPFGAITRRDNLKTAANQAIFEVTFWETTGLIYPAVQGEPASVVLAAVDAFNTSVSEEFAETIEIDNAVEQVTFKNTYSAVLGSVEGALQVIADTTDDVRKQFNAIKDSITQGLDILVEEPLALAFQTALLIQAPARAVTSIEARLDSYGGLVDQITATGITQSENDFRTSDLYAQSYVTGSAVSAVNTQFVTKTDAIAAAEQVLGQFAAVVVWRDDNLDALSVIDTGAAYQKLQEAVAALAGFLVEISFSLKQERRLVLDRSRTYLDLVAELYGKVDSELDFFISSNDLSGDEMIELPTGREVVYYV